MKMLSGLTYSCSCTKKQRSHTRTRSGKYGSIWSIWSAVRKLSHSGDMPRSTNVVASRAWHSRQVLPIDLSSDVAGEHVTFLIIDLPCKTAVNRALNLHTVLIKNCSTRRPWLDVELLTQSSLQLPFDPLAIGPVRYSSDPRNDCAPKRPPECDCGRKSSEGSP